LVRRGKSVSKLFDPMKKEKPWELSLRIEERRKKKKAGVAGGKEKRLQCVEPQLEGIGKERAF